jgi:hypothetical protein
MSTAFTLNPVAASMPSMVISKDRTIQKLHS